MSAPARNTGDATRADSSPADRATYRPGSPTARHASTASTQPSSWAGAALAEIEPAFRYQASTPWSADHVPSESTASSIARHSATAPASPCRSIRVGNSSHQPVANPPFRPDGPPPQMSDSSRTIRALGAISVRRYAVHRPV